MTKLNEVLDDLCARFLANLPVEELNNRIRLGFQVEQAFWFYDDFYRPSVKSLPKLSLKAFCEKLLCKFPFELLALGRGPVTQITASALIDEFYEYKAHVPTCGAIILNESLNKVLLVRGYNSRSTFGFPKGKIAKDEDPLACAIREVLEETSFDASPYARKNDFIQVTLQQQPVRLYIVPGIREATTHFEPLTRREIKEIRWFPIRNLTSTNNNNDPNTSGSSFRFYNVLPFVSELKKWIRKYKNTHLNTKTFPEEEEEIVPESDNVSCFNLEEYIAITMKEWESRIRQSCKKLLKLDMSLVRRAYYEGAIVK